MNTGLIRLVVIAYAAIALVTYGIAAESHRRDAWARYAACTVSIADDQPVYRKCEGPSDIEAPVTGVVSAALWPLWWSWALAENVSIWRR